MRRKVGKLINDLPELYKRDNRRVKFDLLVCRLVQFSETDLDKDSVTPEQLLDVSDQWFVASADIESDSTCLCSQGEAEGEEVKYVTYIKNRFRGYVARIGSTCIEKFGDGNPIKEEVKLLLPLMKNHSIGVNPELGDLMAKQKVIDQLELALIKKTYRKQKLEQHAIDIISVIKAKIAIEKVPPSVTSIAEWMNDFLLKNGENPHFVSPYDRKTVTISQRFLSEYEELRRKLILADASEYEKQSAIRILGGFYSHQTTVKAEPRQDRPNIHKCQLEKLHIEHCNADQLIEIAESKIENYISSLSKNVTSERDIYTVLSVLLDSYDRFNRLVYDINLLDGLQDNIARLENEIQTLPDTIRKAISETEEELKKELKRKSIQFENDLKNSQESLIQKLQTARETLYNEFMATVNKSRSLLDDAEQGLREIEEEKDNLLSQYSLAVRELGESISNDILEGKRKTAELEKITEKHHHAMRGIYKTVENSEKNIVAISKNAEVLA